MSIPVICDRCRQTGIAGEADFSHLGDLLDFEPVPVQPRVNGWDPDAQRAFIALLAATGSKSQSAKAIQRNPHGITQLLKRGDAASFRLAFDRAMAIAKANGSMKIAQGVADAAARNAQLTPPSRLHGLKTPPLDGEGQGWGDEEFSEEDRIRLLENIATKFQRKVAAEREARLNGEIVAADFYLRQITFIEVTFDLTASEFGWAADDVLRDLRRGEYGIREIVSTPFADWLDTRRRMWWLSEGDPERPPHPDPRFLKSHDEGPWGSRGAEGFSTNVDQNAYGACTPPARGYSAEEWAAMPVNEQILAREKQFAEDAREQADWEARAREAWEAS